MLELLQLVPSLELRGFSLSKKPMKSIGACGVEDERDWGVLILSREQMSVMLFGNVREKFMVISM